MLDLVDDALAQGWTRRAAVPSWRSRRVGSAGGGGCAPRVATWPTLRLAATPSHGILEWEAAEILALYDEFGEIDRSHRKLAHRGSYQKRVWVSESSVFRVLAAHGKVLPDKPRPAPTTKKPWPDWVDLRPRQVWGYDVTHFPKSNRAVIAIVDLVSRKWIDHLVCVEETSTQVAAVFTRALQQEGLLVAGLAITADGTVPITDDDNRRPILLAVSDNGPQMTSGSTREFMAMHAIATHFGRPGTPTDRPGAHRKLLRPRQNRLAPPDRHPRPRRAHPRTRPRPRRIQRHPTARRDRLRHSQRRTRRTRSGHPPRPPQRPDLGPTTTHRLPSKSSTNNRLPEPQGLAG